MGKKRFRNVGTGGAGSASDVDGGAGSGGDMSDGGRTKKLKVNPPLASSRNGTPQGSRSVSPAPLSAGTPEGGPSVRGMRILVCSRPKALFFFCAFFGYSRILTFL
jgi:transcription initiation factor TFIIF subunit alpha